jgi:hypothetical protein
MGLSIAFTILFSMPVIAMVVGFFSSKKNENS